MQTVVYSCIYILTTWFSDAATPEVNTILTIADAIPEHVGDRHKHSLFLLDDIVQDETSDGNVGSKPIGKQNSEILVHNFYTFTYV